jgi:hypothetical protein
MAWSGSYESTTFSQQPPLPSKDSPPAADLNITWLVRHLSTDACEPQFAIDRKSEACRTPLANPEAGAAIHFGVELARWLLQVMGQLRLNARSGEVGKSMVLHAGDDSVFQPVVPLFEGNVEERANGTKVISREPN